MLRVRVWCLGFALLLIGSAPATSASPGYTAIQANAQICLKVGFFSDFGEVSTKIALPILNRMYDLAGYCMNAVYMPSNRSKILLQRGELDAEMARAPATVAQMNGQAILVPQPIMKVKIQFTWIDGLPFDGTLANAQNKTVGILRGLPTVHKHIEQYTKSVTLLQNLNSAGELLERGRIDMLVSGGIGYPQMRDNFAKRGIKLRAKSFLEIPAYHVLHYRHTAKAAAFAAALKYMIANGELKGINAEQGLLPAKILPQ